MKRVEESSLALQTGQIGCLESHVSAHSKWKAWLQPGITRADCSSVMSSRQTAHSGPAERSFPVIVGSFWRSEGDRPVLMTGLRMMVMVEGWVVAYQRRHMYTNKMTPMPMQGRNSAISIASNISSFAMNLYMILSVMCKMLFLGLLLLYVYWVWRRKERVWYGKWEWWLAWIGFVIFFCFLVTSIIFVHPFIFQHLIFVSVCALSFLWDKALHSAACYSPSITP